MKATRKLTAVIRREDDGYVALRGALAPCVSWQVAVPTAVPGRALWMS
jgi:hypothetical protein